MDVREARARRVWPVCRLWARRRRPDRARSGPFALARAAEDRRHGLRRRLLPLQLQQGRPGAAQLRRAAQRLLAEPGRGRLREGRDHRQPGRLPHRPRLRQDRRPRGRLRARGRRQGDLQARPAGLRERAGGQQAAARRRQVRDAARGRGDRVAGQLELQPLGPVRLRDPLLPRGPARHAAGERQAERRRLSRERLEQQQRDPRRLPGASA